MRILEKSGQALWEFLIMSAVLVVLTTGILFTAYLIFARAWLAFQSEQTLYCLAEGTVEPQCRDLFAARMRNLLPWGELTIYETRATPGGAVLRAKWRVGSAVFPIRRRLDPSSFKRSRSFRW